MSRFAAVSGYATLHHGPPALQRASNLPSVPRPSEKVMGAQVSGCPSITVVVSSPASLLSHRVVVGIPGATSVVVRLT